MNASPWKAMFWKEWRENLRWAILAGLALSCGLVYAWFHLSQQSGFFPNFEQLWGSENLVLTIATPLFGLALGLLQILPELRRDQWAFLIHRPASRTTLFWGKALPGVCLYLLATVLPLLGLAAWAAQPRHIPAPFDFRFTLAGWAAVLSGLPFYFAGLLVALRPARWYGSRALPILAALLAPVEANGLNEFWQAASICILVTAVLLTAAWGSFLTSGQYNEQSLAFRFGLGFSLFVGIVIAVMSLTTLGISGYEALSPSSRTRVPVTQYVIDSNNRVIRMTFNGNEITSYADQNGRPMPANYSINSNNDGSHVLGFMPVIAPSIHINEHETRYNMPQRYIAPLQTFLFNSDNVACFYLYDHSQGVGYSLRTHRVVGYLGPRGFAGTPEAAGRFTEPLLKINHQNNAAALLFFEKSVYQFDTQTRTMEKIWSSSGTAKLDGAYDLTTYDMQHPSEAIILASDRRFYVLSGTGQPLFTIPYDAEAASSPYITVSMIPQQHQFLFWYSDNVYGLSHHTSKVVTVSSTGQVVKTITLPALTLPALQSPPLDQTPSAFGLIYPPVADAFGIGVALHDHWFDANWKKNNAKLLGQTGLRGFLLLSFLTGLIAAILAWLISRRLGDGRRGQIAWALGGFWLGIYGVLLLLALRAWPARLPCPNCGRLRVVDRELCEHCGAAWLRPARDGTEIFDADRHGVGVSDSPIIGGRGAS